VSPRTALSCHTIKLDVTSCLSDLIVLYQARFTVTQLLEVPDSTNKYGWSPWELLDSFASNETVTSMYIKSNKPHSKMDANTKREETLSSFSVFEE